MIVALKIVVFSFLINNDILSLYITGCEGVDEKLCIPCFFGRELNDIVFVAILGAGSTAELCIHPNLS